MRKIVLYLQYEVSSNYSQGAIHRQRGDAATAGRLWKAICEQPSLRWLALLSIVPRPHPKGLPLLQTANSKFGWLSDPINRIIVALIVLSPPLMVIAGGRSLYGEEYFRLLEGYEQTAATIHGFNYFASTGEAVDFPIVRWSTGLIVMLSVALIGLNFTKRIGSGRALAVLGSLLTFYVTNLILCVPFGVGAYFDRSFLYPLLMFVAVYVSRDDGIDGMIDTAKWCLLLVMIASLIMAITNPELTRRVYEPEVRLPLIDFRLFGLGEHANTFAPLALTLAVLTAHRPFPMPWLNITSFVCASIVILLAQSQTAWVSTTIVVTGSLLFGYRAGRTGRWPQPSATVINVVTAVIVFLICIPALNAFLATRGVQIFDNTSFTGRPEVWNAAMETYLAHPIFGYGLLAWEREFRQAIYLSWAVHAHNQLLQSLSTAGTVGGIGLLVYVVTLSRGALSLNSATRGLAPALLTIILMRFPGEVSINMRSIITSDTLVPLLLFRLLVSPEKIEMAKGAFVTALDISSWRPAGLLPEAAE